LRDPLTATALFDPPGAANGLAVWRYATGNGESQTPTTSQLFRSDISTIVQAITDILDILDELQTRLEALDMD